MGERAVPARSDSLEVLRGSAALLVFFFHCIQFWPDAPRGLLALVHQGNVGVDLFLVISGYVTTTSLLGLRATGRADADREYWKRRLARIFPLYWLTTVAYVLVVPGGFHPLAGPDGWFQALTHLVLIHGWFPSTAISLNSVTWTLTLEAGLYGLGWLALTLFRVERRLVLWTVVVFAMVFAWRTVVFTTVDLPLRFHYAMQVFGACDGFWLGLVCAVAVHRGTFVPSRLSAATKWLLLAGGLLGAHALATAIDGLDHGRFWSSPWCVIPLRSGFAVVFTALLIVVIAARRVPWCLRPLVLAGTWSYGIYLWHLPVILLLEPYWRRWITGAPYGLAPWQLTLAALGITVVLSAASYRLFELPIVRWARRS